MIYKIEITNKAYKELNKLPSKEYPRIRDAINSLANNPHPHNSIKLTDTENEYRMRIGNYRILYTIENKILLITVFKISDRKDAY